MLYPTKLAPQEGFEPPANELTARRSTTELLRNRLLPNMVVPFRFVLAD
jgi:hypothetical protein